MKDCLCKRCIMQLKPCEKGKSRLISRYNSVEALSGSPISHDSLVYAFIFSTNIINILFTMPAVHCCKSSSSSSSTITPTRITCYSGMAINGDKKELQPKTCGDWVEQCTTLTFTSSSEGDEGKYA